VSRIRPQLTSLNKCTQTRFFLRLLFCLSPSSFFPLCSFSVPVRRVAVWELLPAILLAQFLVAHEPLLVPTTTTTLLSSPSVPGFRLDVGRSSCGRRGGQRGREGKWVNRVCVHGLLSLRPHLPPTVPQILHFDITLALNSDWGSSWGSGRGRRGPGPGRRGDLHRPNNLLCGDSATSNIILCPCRSSKLGKLLISFNFLHLLSLVAAKRTRTGEATGRKRKENENKMSETEGI